MFPMPENKFKYLYSAEMLAMGKKSVFEIEITSFHRGRICPLFSFYSNTESLH